MTQILLAIPDDVMQQLSRQGADVPRRALEALAIESYRMGILTSAEVQRM